ncbi:hypothetical protein [Candidatus Leptofilum sp.]|uniref:hypothetical protein n=1 Tax=Candidatus Leptofilum sp. TaxID=3241576 RepID=UPI003B58D02D
MTSILLHEYVEQVETLIDANRLVEAVEHCRHILHHYPRHIDTYRVMGKALLEKQEYDSASDLFLRILGADPNDFISHVGLSIVYQEESQYDQALWHLERAFEIQPYNVAIQGELRQLYTTETESRPGVIPLTRGALARLYMQGELYQQAISELRRILAEEPERIDLQVLLAEALWRDDQRIDAEEVCLNIMEALPNCIVANAILAEIWLQTGRIPEAQKYLKRLHGLTWQTQKSLQKESIAGRAFVTEGAFQLPEKASLEFLETGTVIPDEPAQPADDWVGEVTFDDVADVADGMDDVVLEPESGMHSYDWLADIDAAEGEDSEQKTSETDWFSQESAKESLNLTTSELNADWLADLRGEETEEEESGFQPLEMGSDPGEEAETNDSDWFANEDDISDELFAELADSTELSTEDTAVDTDHDWLKDLAEIEGETSSEPREKSGIQIDATNLMDKNLMDWDQIESDPNIVKEPKTPFWLSEMAGEATEAVELNPEEALDWLTEPEEIAELGASDEPEEPVATTQETEAEQADVPMEVEDSLDWLSEIPDEEADEADEAEIADALLDAAPEAVEESLDWLDDVPSPEPETDVVDESVEDEVEESFGPTAVLDSEEQVDLPEMPNLLDTDSLGEADDWLAALTEGTIEEEIAWDESEGTQKAEEIELDATTDELAALSDADDWLKSASADLDAILEDADREEEEFPNLLIPDMEGAELDEVPDWLHTDTLDDSEEAETAMSSENDPQEKPQSDEPEVKPSETAAQDGDEDALDWLADLTADDADADVLVEPPIATEGMPSWLDDAGQKEGVEVVDEWDSESADIPDWLQEPVELSELDEAILDEAAETDEVGLTGLLSEIDISDEAVPIDDMNSLFSDWADEDGDGSLTELLSEMSSDEPAVETQAADLDFVMDAADEEPEPAESVEEPEEVGLTGLLSNLSLEDELEEPVKVDEDDFFSGLLAEADDDLGDLLGDDGDVEDIGLTAMLSGMELEEDDAETKAVSDETDDDWLTDVTEATDDDDDWLADLTEASEAETEPDASPEVEEAEAELGLTGMLANLWPDDEEAVESELPEMAVSDPTGSEPSKLNSDELGLTELLAGIDYAEDAIDSRPELPELEEPVEPSLTEILGDMDVVSEPEEPELEEAGPISAEDTTWLTQLEADTGALQEQADDFDMAEETGLDWLTLPDEPVEDLPVDAPEEPAALDEPEVVEEQDSTPEDWDDAMSWLEELAAQQEDPVAELPSVAENMLDEELDSGELLQADDIVAEEEAIGSTDWLDDLTGDVTTALDEELIDPELLAETGVMAEPPQDSDETAVSQEEETDADPLDGWDDDGEMSWLDELATDQLPETAVDEAETTQEPVDTTLSEEDGAGWLDDLVADDAEIVLEADLLDDLLGDVADEAETAVDEAETIPEPIDTTSTEEDDASWLGDLVADDAEIASEADLLDDLFDDVAEDVETAVDDPDIGWLDTVIDEAEDEAEAVVEESLDAATPEVVDDEEYRVTGVTDALKADDGLEEAEADLEEALAWLDELDEEPEVELLDEAPPTIITPPEPHELPEPVVDEASPDTVVLPPEPDELTLALDRLEQQVRDEGIDVPEAGVFPIMLSDEELNAALDWIEQGETEPEQASESLVPDEQTEAAVESLQEVEESTEDDLTRMADDPEAWLEDLLSGDADLDVDMEPPPIKPSEDAVFVTDDGVEAELEDVEIAETDLETADSLLEDVALEGMPDDPDAAVAWLDQLVSGDDALDIEMEPPPIKPSEDAVFVTDDAPAEDEPPEEAELVAAEDESETAVADEVDLEDDPEAWLEQMLSDDLAMDVEMEPPPIKPSEDAVYVTEDGPPMELPDDASEPDEIVAAPEPIAELPSDEIEEAATEIGDMEDDPEAWLEQMLSGDLAMDVEMEPPPIKPSEDAVYVTEDASPEPEAAPEPEVVAEVTEPAEDIIADVPDDPDEAMAWLEQLAARQGADLAELPTVTDASDVADEPAMPDWMAQDLAELDAGLDEPIAVDEPAEAEDSAGETGDLADTDVDSELPDWLSSSDNRPVAGETDWLQNLPEVDMDSWLSAEAEAVAIEPTEDVQLPDTGPLRTDPLEAEPLAEDELFDPVIEPSSGAYSVDEAKLGAAKEALTDGRIEEAMTQYKSLVADGSGMMAIIADLEQATDAHPQTPVLFQVLGDAYMRNGQLQKALAAYRSALNQM